MLRRIATVLGAGVVLALAQSNSATNPDAACKSCIEAHENFLASDAMHGRGSGTSDELLAATYIASELQAYGIAPAAPGGYIEIAPASVRQRRANAIPATAAPGAMP